LQVGEGIKLSQVFNELPEIISLLFVHNEAWNPKLVIDKLGGGVAEVAISSTNPNKNFGLCLLCTLEVLCIFSHVSYVHFVRMNMPRELAILAFYILLGGVCGHV
jgi:hypothetical protein